MQHMPYDKVISQLNIKKGDALLVSSDIKKFMWNSLKQKEKFDIQHFIDTLTDAVGEEGTLIFPTYNWDFCKGVPFDYVKTPGKTGALGVAALKRSDFKRSKHPLYSCAIWGKDKEMLCERDYRSSFGEDSIFAYLHEMKGKNLLLDVTLQHCFTYAHYVEQQSGVVSYRYLKQFTADYIDANGERQKKTYEMFVRDLNLDVINLIDPYEEDFLENGIAEVKYINDSKFFLIELDPAYRIILDDIKNHSSRKLCSYIGQNVEKN